MVTAELERVIRKKYEAMKPELDERSRRRWAAIEARAIGWGGISAVSAATGMSSRTIRRGLEELKKPVEQSQNDGARRVRKPGGGRKRLIDYDPTLIRDLDALVEPSARGDPTNPLRWTCKSTRKLAKELNKQGHKIGRQKVDDLLHMMNYSLQSNSKVKEGSSHPDRNAQFEYINDKVHEFQERNQPVVSVDAKKKENIGDYKNNGREWRPRGDPELVRVYDFVDKELGKGIPYGVYDPTTNMGWVSVGTDHDTAEFAGATILQWWQQMGFREYPDATELLITADGGGSNSSRTRLWKIVLQRLANNINLKISVCHFPPGTSKWNKIEHRMFAFITKNWRGKPLASHEVMINLIANTTTEKGLRIRAALDNNKYPTGKKVSDQELNSINISRADFHGEWNYKISPKSGVK
jgi:Rhodopirellula transposase DDE domain